MGRASGFQTSLARWRATDSTLGSWQRSGVLLGRDGALRLDPATAAHGTDPYPAGTYNSGNFYNGGSFFVGEVTGPVYEPGFAFAEAIPSWEADTPNGTWIEVQMRAQSGGHWTRWFNLGVWASSKATVARHSVSGQSDATTYVDTDTLVMGKQGSPPQATGGAVQLKVRLFSTNRAASPVLRSASVSVSAAPSAPSTFVPGDRSRWNVQISMSQCSQMVYPDGGEVWCSPTSVAMVLGYWRQSGASCETRVRAAVDGVYDWVYDGHGNWPFNAAYAATQPASADNGATRPLEAYATRFGSLAQAEEWIAAGVPVIFSIGWKKGELAGAPVSSSSGHLAVLVGFMPSGDPIVNDPAAPSNDTVQHVYDRHELETLWLSRGGGTVYLVYPQGWPVPGPSFAARCVAATKGETQPPACRE